jgi:hypothetical protein
VVPYLSVARAMLEEHQQKTGPFRVARDACQATAADLDGVAAALRACDAATPLGAAAAAARLGVAALAGWTDAPVGLHSLPGVSLVTCAYGNRTGCHLLHRVVTATAK